MWEKCCYIQIFPNEVSVLIEILEKGCEATPSCHILYRWSKLFSLFSLWILFLQLKSSASGTVGKTNVLYQVFTAVKMFLNHIKSHVQFCKKARSNLAMPPIGYNLNYKSSCAKPVCRVFHFPRLPQLARVSLGQPWLAPVSPSQPRLARLSPVSPGQLQLAPVIPGQPRKQKFFSNQRVPLNENFFLTFNNINISPALLLSSAKSYVSILLQQKR